jgi:hypothetical protein
MEKSPSKNPKNAVPSAQGTGKIVHFTIFVGLSDTIVF